MESVVASLIFFHLYILQERANKNKRLTNEKEFYCKAVKLTAAE